MTFESTGSSLTRTSHTVCPPPGPRSWELGARSPAALALACLLGRCLHRREDSLLLAFLTLGWREKGMERGPEGVLQMVVSFAPKQPSVLRGHTSVEEPPCLSGG